MTGVPMMLHLFLLLGQQAANVDEVLDRFAVARAKPTQIEVTLTSRQGLGPVVPLQVRLNGSESTWFTSTPQGGKYTLSITPKGGVVELDASVKEYDLHSYPGEVKLFSSRISSELGRYPDWLFVTDLRKPGSQPLPWKLVGSAVVNGFPADKIEVKQPGLEIQAAIDKLGHIVSFDRTIESPMGVTRQRWDVSKWVTKSLSDSDLAAPIPVGYMPFALNYSYGGLEVGGKFPLEGWSKPIDGSGMRLVVVLGEDSDPSLGAYKWLSNWRGSVPVTLISDGSGASRYQGALSDPSGKNLDAIDVQGTPYFALINGQGEIVKLWMGFDPKTAKALEADIVSAASGKSE